MTINGVPVRFFECEADWHEKCFYGIIQCSLQGFAQPTVFCEKHLINDVSEVIVNAKCQTRRLLRRTKTKEHD